MAGYGGPDDDAQAAQDLRDNAINEARNKLYDPSKEILECIDCGSEIPEKRRRAMPGCPRCVSCQSEFDKLPRAKVRMVDIMT